MADHNDDAIEVDNNDQQQQKIQAGAHTTLAFKVEQSKILELFGQKAKDTISALNFMMHIDNLAKTNNWSDFATYNNFANAFTGVARRWLYLMVDMLNYGEDQFLWSIFKPRFQKENAVQTNDKLIMEGLSNLTMKPNEDTRDLINRIADTIVIIKESYINYRNKVARPHQDLNGGWLDATGEKYNSDIVNNLQPDELFQDATVPGSSPTRHQKCGRTKRPCHNHLGRDV
jgi:hypothetical protein